MAIEKTLGLVTRVVEFSETSCVLTLFSEEFGKVSALAKGARRPKSAFEGAIDLLALCRLVLLRKNNASLDLLTEAKLERRFRAGGRNLQRLYAGYYVAETLNEMTEHGDPHPQLFQVADQTLLALERGDAVGAATLWWEISTLGELGHLPALWECASCGNDVESNPRTSFGLLAGGVLCPNCRVGQRSVVSVSRDALERLRTLASGWMRQASWDEIGEDAANWRGVGELRGLLNQVFANLWGKRPRMQRYLTAASN